MRVKICGIHDETDLANAVKAGADAVGFLVGQVHNSPDFILSGTAARLLRKLPPAVSPVIVTHLTEPAEVFDLVVRTGITTVQLHGGSTPEQAAQLRDMLPPSGKLILVQHLTCEDNFYLAKELFLYKINVFSSVKLQNCKKTGNRFGLTALASAEYFGKPYLCFICQNTYDLLKLVL